MKNSFSAYQYKVIRESNKEYDVKQADCCEEVAKYLYAFGLHQACQEQFYVLILDAKNHIVGHALVTQGLLDSTKVHPREVFKYAILQNAKKIIVAHNHPTGELSPSPQDKEITTLLIQAGEILGIPVLDHMIVGIDFLWHTKEYYSFRANGLIQ